MYILLSLMYMCYVYVYVPNQVKASTIPILIVVALAFNSSTPMSP